MRPSPSLLPLTGTLVGQGCLLSMLCTYCPTSMHDSDCVCFAYAYRSTSPMPYCPSQYLVASKRTADGNRRTTSHERQTRECRETLRVTRRAEEPVVRLQAEPSGQRSEAQSEHVCLTHYWAEKQVSQRTSNQRVSQR